MLNVLAEQFLSLVTRLVVRDGFKEVVSDRHVMHRHVRLVKLVGEEVYHLKLIIIIYAATCIFQSSIPININKIFLNSDMV